jgi:SulP family sulfate permease
VAVAAYLIPQVMAYAAIIGVPPVASLWTALAAIITYAVLGSSRILSAGPESTVALMTAVAIAPLAAHNPDRAVALSAALALIVAGWAVLARLLRAGIIAELLSTPLLAGYLAGSAVLMVVSQLDKVTGTSFEGGSIIDEARGFLGVSLVGMTRSAALPTRLGMTSSPVAGMKTRSAPATIPGAESGRVISLKTCMGLEPKSMAASFRV